MIKDIIIRKATRNDVHGLNKLINQLGHSLSFDEMDAILMKYLYTPNHNVFVVELSGNVVGCAGLIICHYLTRTTNFAQLVSFVIDEQFRNQQIGSILLSYLENYSQEHGCVKIQLTSGLHRQVSGAHRFYLNNGYKVDTTKFFIKELN